MTAPYVTGIQLTFMSLNLRTVVQGHKQPNGLYIGLGPQIYMTSERLLNEKTRRKIMTYLKKLRFESSNTTVCAYLFRVRPFYGKATFTRRLVAEISFISVAVLDKTFSEIFEYIEEILDVAWM